MEKKWLSVAGLWLALIALVFIYTDRNEYTWRYEGDELGQIVISSEEADARQTQADAAMALEQQAAQAVSVVRQHTSQRVYQSAGEIRRGVLRGQVAHVEPQGFFSKLPAAFAVVLLQPAVHPADNVRLEPEGNF